MFLDDNAVRNISLKQKKYNLNRDSSIEQCERDAYVFFVVDDDKEELFLISEKLKSIEKIHTINTFLSAAELFKSLSEHGFFENNNTYAHLKPVLFIDINMPKVNGLDILNQVKNHPLIDDIPVILCSNNATEDHIYNAMRYEAHSCLDKNFSGQDLMKILDNIDNPAKFYTN